MAETVDGATLRLSPPMYAAVRDSLGLVPLPLDDEVSARDAEKILATVIEGVHELEAAGLVTGVDDVLVIAPVVQGAVKAVIDPDVILRSVVTWRGSNPVVTSIFWRDDLPPVAFSGPESDGARTYLLSDVDMFIDLVVEQFGSSTGTYDQPIDVPTEDLSSWIQSLENEGDHVAPELFRRVLPRSSEVDVVGNIAIVSLSGRVGTDGRNAALIGSDDRLWLVSPRREDPALSQVRVISTADIRDWTATALSELL